jgi:exosortase
MVRKVIKGLDAMWPGISLAIGWSLLFGSYLFQLMVFAFNSNVYTHILIVPPVFAYLLYLNRQQIFADRQKRWSYTSITLLLVGALIFTMRLVMREAVEGDDALFLTTLSSVLVFWGLFSGYFGYRSFIKALFPLSFLLLMVPLPAFALDAFIRILQTASAETIAVIFHLVNIPFFREGAVFTLPGLSIEVAPECSGIRSSLALIVISLLASYLFLERFRNRAIMMAIVLPVSIFKNALRIVLLACLGAYVDIGFITDSMLHREGGRPFLILAALLLALVLWILRRHEKRSGSIQTGTDKVQAGINSEPAASGAKR